LSAIARNAARKMKFFQMNLIKNMSVPSAEKKLISPNAPFPEKETARRPDNLFKTKKMTKMRGGHDAMIKIDVTI
jgi:hypothetical protein